MNIFTILVNLILALFNFPDKELVTVPDLVWNCITNLESQTQDLFKNDYP